MMVSTIDKDSQVSDLLSSAYMKILLSYLQIISLIGNLKLNWTKSLAEFFNINQVVTGSFLQVISFDCLFKGFFNIYSLLIKILDGISIEPIYLIPLIGCLMPWLLLALIIFVWIIIGLIYHNNIMLIFDKFVSIMVITIFSMQPAIINYLLNIISCREVDRNKYFISTYLSEECNTEKHYSWIYKLFIPGFIFYGCFLPVLAFVYMRINKFELHERHHVKKIGFLSSGYKKKKFYW